jgi:hypothetical protein
MSRIPLAMTFHSNHHASKFDILLTSVGDNGTRMIGWEITEGSCLMVKLALCCPSMMMLRFCVFVHVFRFYCSSSERAKRVYRTRGTVS